VDLLRRDRRIEIEKGTDAAAHATFFKVAEGEGS
jgi:hypothetical protein